MATAHRPCQRFALMGLIGAFLAGCSQGGSSLPRVLRIAKSSTDPGGLDVEASVRDRRVVKDVQALLQDFDPGLRLHPPAIRSSIWCGRSPAKPQAASAPI